jgi:hypothetical protein
MGLGELGDPCALRGQLGLGALRLLAQELGGELRLPGLALQVGGHETLHQLVRHLGGDRRIARLEANRQDEDLFPALVADAPFLLHFRVRLDRDPLSQVVDQLGRRSRSSLGDGL